VALRFITRHSDAVALDLGAGLDTRMFRIAPPATVDWYDIDFPEVVTARQHLLPDRANTHGIGMDLTDATWLDAIPTDRPAVIVADLIRSPGFDDPHEPERWNPSLKLVREILLTREPEVAQFPLALRLVTRLAAHNAAWSRRGSTVLHYRF
jgi:hypothetical protein